MKKNTFIFALLLSFACSVSYGQEEVHSDIEFSYVDGQIVIEEGAEGFIFEGEFGEGAFANFASEPGIASEVEEGAGVNPSNLIGFNVLGGLFYWDGQQATATNASVTIDGLGGSPDAVVSQSSGILPVDFGLPANLLGQAAADGDFHVDPGFTISDGALSGGYGLVLSLATNDDSNIADSAPFGVFLNFGLEEDSFEAGVDAFSATVPEPAPTLLFGLALSAFSLLRPKRSKLELRS